MDANHVVKMLAEVFAVKQMSSRGNKFTRPACEGHVRLLGALNGRRCFSSSERAGT